jgi:hypothetical protein
MNNNDKHSHQVYFDRRLRDIEAANQRLRATIVPVYLNFIQFINFRSYLEYRLVEGDIVSIKFRFLFSLLSLW